MKQPTIKVYDDHVSAATGATTTVYSSLDHMRALSDMQPLALHAVLEVQNIPKQGQLEVQIQHSGDGIHFQRKNAASEIPAFSFFPDQLASRAGAETFTTPPSHDYVRIAMMVTGVSGNAFGILKVYATGQRRVNRPQHEMTRGEASVHDALRRHLPAAVAMQVEAFRHEVGMSAETLGELRRLWRDGGGAASDAGRAEHAAFYLSPKARSEFARFTRSVASLPAHVKRALKAGVAKAALAELARPDWSFDDDEGAAS